MSVAVASEARADKEHFLLPGQWHFGCGGRIRTLLGSCVAVTLWHPTLLLGGMCHFVLPTSGKAHAKVLDGRYGDQAVAALVQSAQRASPRLLEFRVGLYGGGRMFGGNLQQGNDIGQRNIEAAQWLLACRHLLISDTHCGGTGHRNISLDLETGEVSVRHAELTAARDRG